MDIPHPLLTEPDETAALEELNKVMIATHWVKEYILAKRQGKLVDIHSSDAPDLQEDYNSTAGKPSNSYLRTLSYKLRGFLTPILGWSQLLRTHQLDQSTAVSALESIERNAKLQLKLIEEFLEADKSFQSASSSIDSSKLVLDEISQRRLLSEIGPDGLYVAETLLTDFGLDTPAAVEAAYIIHLVYTANRLTA